MLETIKEVIQLVNDGGLVAVVVLLCGGIVWLAVQFYKEKENTKSTLEKQVEQLRAEINQNKQEYTTKLEGLIDKLQQQLERNSAVITQNSEIIKNFIQWREK